MPPVKHRRPLLVINAVCLPINIVTAVIFLGRGHLIGLVWVVAAILSAWGVVFYGWLARTEVGR